MRTSSKVRGLRRASVLFAGISVLLVGIGLSPAAAATLAFTADSPAEHAAVGTAYSYTFASNDSGAHYGVFSGTVPTGMTIDPTTGVLSGTPTTAGTYTFAVQVDGTSGFEVVDGATNTIVVSGPGSTFVADTNNSQILEVPAAGGSPIAIDSGISDPEDLAVDQAGDIYVVQPNPATVTEIPADGRAPLPFASTVAGATRIAVDAVGNVYTSAPGTPTVTETLADGSGTQTLGAGLGSPNGLAVDAAGDLFVVSADKTDVFEIPAAAPRTQKDIGSSLADPVSIAVDQTGDTAYVGEAGPSPDVVEKVSLTSGTGTQLQGGMSGVAQVAADGSGNVVIADGGDEDVLKVPGSGGSASTVASGLGNPQGVAVLAPNLSFTDDTPPANGTVESGYVYQFGTSAQATFSVINGAIPDGLEFDSTGDLSGSPLTPGNYTFNVLARPQGGALGGIVSPPINIVINDAGSGVNSLNIFYAVPQSDGVSFEVAGLLVGTPNTTFNDLQIDAQDSCHDEGGTVATLSVTTDANGAAYFATSIDTDPLVFVPHVGNDFWGNCYPVGPDNTSWSKASDITFQNGVGTDSGYIGVTGESRWYKFPVTPDSSVTVTLSGLTSDDALAVYGDIGAAASATTTTPLDEQAAEQPGSSFSPSAFTPSAFTPSAFTPSAFTPSAFTPSAFTPSAFTPSAFTPSAFTPSAFTPSAFTPSAFTPSAFTPSAFTPSAFTPSAFTPSAFTDAGFTPSAFTDSSYSSAIGTSLIGYSDDGGNADKTVTVNTWSNTGYFYVAVAGNNGATDPDVPFTVTVNDGSGSCSPTVVPQGNAPANVAAGNVKTVLLTDTSRVAGTSADKSFMLSQLQAVAARPEVAGTVIDLASDSRVQGLQTQADKNPDCPFAENLVANAIRDIVNSYRANNPLTYVVLAGGDSTIPFFRHPDQTLIGNETGYSPPLADQTAAQAALRLGYVLSDNDYGAKVTLVSKSDSYPVPDLAVGRLVESASEISGQLTNYLATNGGVVATPTSSLVTGYDFLTLAANQVESNLTAGIGTGSGTKNDTLIQPDGDSPSVSWTGTDLANKVLNSGRHDVVFLAGHFSANDTLAADYSTDVITTQMEQSSVNLTDSLVFSPGCHSGYNIPDSEALPGVTLTLDWPQEFARKGAIFIGGTGYQYGDTDFVAYSEAIDANLSHNLLLGSGAVSIGQALLKAKQDYLSSQSDLGAIQQKAVLEAEMYGLPMESINMPDGRIPTTTATSGVTPTGAPSATPGGQLGLSSADVTVTSSLTKQSKQLTDITDPSAPPVTATYYTGGSGVSTNPYEPVLPLESKNITAAGDSVRGVLFLGGHYSDESGVTPLVDAPTTETGGVHTGFSSSVYYPQQPWSVNQLGALDGTSTGGTNLYVTPAQHISDPSGGTDTRRTYSDTTYRVFYLGNSSTVAQSAAPTIASVTSQIDPNDPTKVDVCADLGGNPTAGIQEALVTWSDASKTSGQWQSEDITAGGCDPSFYDAGGFGGTISLGDMSATDLRFMVQAVNGIGLVTMDNNLGAYFSLPSQDQSFPFGTSTVTHFTETTTNAPYGTSETLSATLNDVNDNSNPPSTTPISGETLTFKLGTATATGVTGDDGVATATFPLNVAPGTYTPSASFGGNDDDNPSSGQGDGVTVTKQVSHLDLAVTSGTLSAGDTSYTVTLCATGGSSCGTTDPLLTQKTVLMQLTGPLNRTTSIQTGGAGQARFDTYGLPAGRYTLKATFGAVAGLTTASDPYYGDSTASTMFGIQSSSTTPPTLTVPASITVPATTTAGAVVSFTASATDPVDPRPTVTCNPGSVSLFPVGPTQVSCTATDSAGNTSAAKTFLVTVSPPPGTATDVLQYSVNADRSAPANLAGSTVSGGIYVFAAVPSTDRSVVFSLDGKVFHAESTYQFDFNGTKDATTAYPFATSSLADGSHTISAAVTSSTGVVTNVSSVFTVQNGTAAPPQVLQVSSNANRSASKNLDAATLTGNVYIYANVPATDRQVSFSLDGNPFHNEGSAPFDFNGTAAADGSTAFPFSTATLTDGQHTVTETAVDSASVTTSTSATFTVSNGTATPPPAMSPLRVSTHADRSAPFNLDGATLTGSVYVFDVPSAAVTSVQFTLDGKAYHLEGTTPYDFNGTADATTALPYNLSGLSKAKHTITAVVTFTTGRTETDTGTFTVT